MNNIKTTETLHNVIKKLKAERGTSSDLRYLGFTSAIWELEEAIDKELETLSLEDKIKALEVLKK